MTTRLIAACLLHLIASSQIVLFAQAPESAPDAGASEAFQAEPQEEEEFDPWEDHLETDRDSFTPATSVVGCKRLMVESAYSFIDERETLETHSFPELLVRYGLTERIELRAGWNYEIGGGGNSVSGSGGGSLDVAPEGMEWEEEHRIAYGLKAVITEQCGWRPDSAFIIQGLTPTGGESTATQLVATYVFGWEFANEWQFDSALRYATDSVEEHDFGIWAPSAVLKIPVKERWSVHAEYFGLFSHDRPESRSVNYISPGVHYLATPNLEVGVRVGWGLSPQSPNFFSNAGIGWRY